MTTGEVESQARLLRNGDRRTLARLITAAESSLPENRRSVHDVLRACVQAHSSASESSPRAMRVAFTGPPGAGKSTLIEALGPVVLAQGGRLAVLSIDPSSPRSGGSLLGDQTRMPSLSARSDVFIRPSPSRDHLGGLGPGTETALELCEWASFDPIFVETVGVGQNEVEVGELVDWVVLVIPPDAGDDVSGMKRGITESCDFLVVNKVDLSRERAEATRDHYRAAMSLLGRTVPLPMLVSAVHGLGIEELWRAIQEAHAEARRTSAIADRRAAQRRGRLTRAIRRRFEASLREPERAALLARAEAQMEQQGLSAEEAAARLWDESFSK